MSAKIYMLFLIFCVVFYEGVIATLSAEGAKESSDILMRKRRVVTHIPGATNPIKIQDANYIVNIKKNNNAHCAGAILSDYTVITAASCVNLHISIYQVLSAARYENYGMNHSLTSIVAHYGNAPLGEYDGIALITVDPPFPYNSRTGHISLYAGPLAAGTRVVVSGWGVSYPPRCARFSLRRGLRSITLPIMNHEECKNIYQYALPITEKHICTNDEQQYCARTDAGAPLVINNSLAGIHVYKGESKFRTNPDVYINLLRNEYSAWIREHVLSI